MLLEVARKAVALYRQARIGMLGDHTAWRSVGAQLEMEIDPCDWMDRSFFLGTYDPWLLLLMDRMVRPGDTAVDIGAHKGYVALQLARRVGPAGRVLAFEPDPRARVCLEKHRDRNRLDTLTVLPVAVGSERGEATFALSKQLGWSSFHPNAEALPEVAERVTIPVRALDDLVADGELAFDPAKLSFLKLDVEGHEPLALRGMANLLRSAQPVLWIEINRPSLAAAGFSEADVVNPLTEAGYSMWRVRRTRQLAKRRIDLEPITSLSGETGDVFDVVATRGLPGGLPIAPTVASTPRRFGPGTISRDAAASLFYSGAVRVGTAMLSIVVARFLGPSGAGRLGIALQAAALGGLAATLNIPQGLTRLLAANEDPQWRRRLVTEALLLILLLGAVIGGGLTALAGPIAVRAYADASLVSDLRVCGVLVLCMAVYLWAEGALQGLRRFGALAIWGGAIAVCDLLLVFPAARAGVAGVLIARAAVRLLAVLVAWFLWLRHRTDTSIVKIASAAEPAPATSVRSLLHFAGPTFLGGAVTFATLLLLRALLVRRFGLEAAGHLQAADSLAQGLLLVPLAATTAFMPAISRAREITREDFALLFHRGFVQISWLHLAICLAAMAIVPLLVTGIFGRDFSASRPVFLWLAMAYGLCGQSMVFGAAMLGRGEVWAGAGVNLLWSVTALTVFALQIGPVGAPGVAFAMGCAYLILLAACVVMLRVRWRLPGNNLVLPLAGTPLLLGIALFACLTPGLSKELSSGICLALAIVALSPLLRGARLQAARG